MTNAKVEKRKIIIVISLIALISLLVAGLFTIFGRQKEDNSLIASAGATSSLSVFVNPDLKTALPQTTPGPSINKKIEVYPSKSSPKIKKTHPKVISQSTKEETKNPPTIHKKTTTKVVKKTVSNPTSAPIVVKPKPKPTPAPKKNGTKPEDSDWTKINPNVPRSLYDYNYTKFEDFDITTSAEIDSKAQLTLVAVHLRPYPSTSGTGA